YHKLTMALLIGGVSFKDQDKLIDRGVDVLIATPGRLLDHFERGKLMLTGVQIMVVDEADRMLDMGFIPDIERIFKLTPFTRQTLFFSATMPPEITRLTQEFLHNPVRVEVTRQATAPDTVTQRACLFTPSRRDRDQASKEKRACLRALMEREGEGLRNAIIFCNRKTEVALLHKSLVKHGYNAGALHGDLVQSQRTATLNSFREGEIKLLVASDVAARGLDIPNVSHIFNYDVPIHAEDYIHRIGRTGRAGREGTALTIAAPLDRKYLDRVEELLGRQIDRIEIPDAKPGGSSAPASDAGSETRTRPERKPRRRRDERAAEKPIEKPVAEPAREREAAQTTQTATAKDSTPVESTVKPAPEPAVQKDAKRDEGGKSRDRSRGRGGRRDRHVVGMGDHVPAFMMRPTRPAKATDTSESPEGAESTPETDPHPEGAAA
ncbi:MAG: DEAD/DEAH box helicase, partial [Alphaproteobacteria bacterium]